MRKVVIIGSGSLREKGLERKVWWEDRGYEVLNYPQKLQSEGVDNINQEYKNLYMDFFKDLRNADIVFLMNEDKKGIEGYIGAESFAELGFVNAENLTGIKKTEIFILKMPSEEVGCHEEIDFFLKLGWIGVLDKK